MPTATATIGTIPALTQYQPGGLPLSGDERFEIVSTGSATTAASYQMLLTDIGKIPSVLPLNVPSQTDLMVFYDTASGVPYSTRVSSIGGSGGTGALPPGGTTGTLLYKLSDIDSDATWTGITDFIGATGVLYTTGSATSFLVGLQTSSIGSTFIIPFSVGSGQLNTAGVSRANIAPFAVASGQIETGGVSGPNIANFAIGSTQLNTSGVVRANLTGFLVGSAQIDTSGVVRANFTNYAVGSTQVATGGIDRFNVATNAIGDAQLRTAAALSVIGNYSTSGGGVADITAAGSNLFLQTTATGVLWGSAPTGTGTLTNGGAAQLLIGVNATNAPQWQDVSGAITIGVGGTTYLGTAVVTTLNLSAGAVNSTKVTTGGIVASNVASFTLGSAQINTGGVSQANIANFAIGSAQVNTSGISNANIANFAINSTKIATGSVVGANIANFAIGSSQVNTSGISQANIAVGAVGSTQIATNAVGSTQLATGSVGTNQALTTVIALQGQTNTWTGSQKFSTGGLYVQGWTAQSYSVATITGNNKTFIPDPALGQYINIVLGGNNLTGTFQFNPPPSGGPTQILTEVINSGVVSATFTTSTSFVKVDGNWTNTASAAFFFIATQSRNYNYLQIVPLQ